MNDRCELKAAHGIVAHCDHEACVYWRLVGHLGVVEEASGCAIQYFGLLGERGGEIAGWLLSVKERVEAEEQGASGAA